MPKYEENCKNKYTQNGYNSNKPKYKITLIYKYFVINLPPIHTVS